MDHDLAKEKLWTLRDGELGGEEKAAVRAHLDACAECRAHAARLDDLASALFRSATPPTRAATEAFVSRVIGRLETRESPLLAWLGSRWLTPALAAGSACLFLFVALPTTESLAPGDSLLLTDDETPGVSESVLPPDPARTDNPLAFVMEDR